MKKHKRNIGLRTKKLLRRPITWILIVCVVLLFTGGLGQFMGLSLMLLYFPIGFFYIIGILPKDWDFVFNFMWLMAFAYYGMLAGIIYGVKSRHGGKFAIALLLILLSTAAGCVLMSKGMPYLAP